MLRLNELKLPLDHLPADLPPAICARLGIAPEELLGHTIVRRGNDARKKSAIKLVYALDVALADEAPVLARFAADPQVRPTPDTTYRFVTRAPGSYSGPRPVVIGAGQSPGEGFGNGRATAMRFAREGARVLAVDRRLDSADVFNELAI